MSNEEIVVDQHVPEEDITSTLLTELKNKRKQVPTFQPTFNNFIVVDNVPVVKQDKHAKLLSVIHRIYTQFEKNLPKENVILPSDPTTTETKGFAFVKFSTEKAAAEAKEKTHAYKLDKNHIFTVNFFSDFARLESVPDVYEPLQLKEVNIKENLRWWVSNPNEQFVLRYGDETEVFWNDTITAPQSIIKKSKWSDKFVDWSTLGSFLVTVHNPGVILWGGEKWNRIHRFQHQLVVSVAFSPQERYLVTFSQFYFDKERKNESTEEPMTYLIWDVVSGKKLRGFTHGEAKGKTAPPIWPIFKWSFDDKYFARLGTNKISVYEAPGMGLLNQKSINISNVRAFEWSPSSHMLVCWTEETSNTPAKVIVYDIPSCEVVFQKPFFSVKECTIFWQTQGKYFGVKIDRHIKKNKSVATSFEIFSTIEKDFPTEVLAIPEKEKVVAYSWEPKGDRFAVVHGDQSSHGRYNVSFYNFTKKLELIKTLEGRQANSLYWSPLGRFILLAGIKDGMGGALEFYNVDMLESMGEATHDTATQINWDPSGRFVATSSSAWDGTQENGYIVWSFKGDQIAKLMKDKFFQFLWRPRPPTLLTAEKEEEIKSKLKEYIKKYRKVVKMDTLLASNSQLAMRESRQKEFDALSRKWAACYASEKARRVEIRGYDSDEEDLVDVITNDEIVTETDVE